MTPIPQLSPATLRKRGKYASDKRKVSVDCNPDTVVIPSTVGLREVRVAKGIIKFAKPGESDEDVINRHYAIK